MFRPNSGSLAEKSCAVDLLIKLLGSRTVVLRLPSSAITVTLHHRPVMAKERIQTNAARQVALKLKLPGASAPHTQSCIRYVSCIS